MTAQRSATVSRLLDALVADPGLAGRPPEPPARLHGDLWNGNVLWTADGVVLVDPAAHGGHRETDLAMLALFDLPHLDRVLAAYDEAAPLPTAGGAGRAAPGAPAARARGAVRRRLRRAGRRDRLPLR